MRDTYTETRGRLETYFDQTAKRNWERLTSDAPVSGIRQTVREGRDAMRAQLLSLLPEDLAGMRILDAGCGTGAMSEALALKGAEVVAIDLSANLIDIAKTRVSQAAQRNITFAEGDMLTRDHGAFDYVVAMDSIIHYRPADAAETLTGFAGITRRSVLFTVAPKTPLLSAMHMVGKLFPRGDRSPAIVPVSSAHLANELKSRTKWRLTERGTVSTSFYISQAMELKA